MTVIFRPCSNDDDFAQVGLFLLQYRRLLHPSYTTMDTVELLYMYITEGHLIQGFDSGGRLASIGAYYHGGPVDRKTDKRVGFVDVAIIAPEAQRSRMFLKGLAYMIDHMEETYPDIDTVHFAALQSNRLLCRMYGKLADFLYEQEGMIEQESVFGVKIHKLRATLRKYGIV